MFLSSSVFFAIKSAIQAARKDAGRDVGFRLDSPCTPERIRMSCADTLTDKVSEFVDYQLLTERDVEDTESEYLLVANHLQCQLSVTWIFANCSANDRIGAPRTQASLCIMALRK